MDISNATLTKIGHGFRKQSALKIDVNKMKKGKDGLMTNGENRYCIVYTNMFLWNNLLHIIDI